MNKYKTSRWRLTILSESHLICILNRIRRRPDILNCKGYFKLAHVKELSENGRYRSFEIPKKRGGKRVIFSPERNLAFLQYCIAVLINSIYKPNACVHGFTNGKSIVSNALAHVNQDIVYNIDLQDFFSSISYETIIEKLIRQPYYFSYRAAKLIAMIVTVNTETGQRVLPQGAPSSPIFTNIVADHMDVRLQKLSEKYGMTYTRYADDITFSFDKKALCRWSSHGFIKGLKDIIEDIIQTEGFKINKKKTRISFPNQRHEVTGLIVSGKVNVRREYIKRLRTEIHNWEKDGYVIASYKFFNVNRKGSDKNLIIHPMQNVIEGKLSYLRMVKGPNDSTYLKLKLRFLALLKRDKQFLVFPHY